MSEEEKKEEVTQSNMEMFLITDFNIIKKLLTFASFPSHTYVYQMPDKADKYVDGTVDKSAALMNQLLEYHRSEDWRVSELSHINDFSSSVQKIGEEEKDIVELACVDRKTQQQYKFAIAAIKEAIIVPDLHSVVMVPDVPLLGNIAPNAIIRMVGLVQHKYFKCVLTGEDDSEHEGQRILAMHYEPIDLSGQNQIRYSTE